jgi:hypothetical protein
VAGEFIPEGLHAPARRVETDVPLIAGEVDQVTPIEVERGNGIADRLDGAGCLLLDDRPELLQYDLSWRRKFRNVLVD